MVFINPSLAVAGLACIALPILIHILMRRRRRPVAFGAMRFLIEAYKRQRRRMNLEQILLLASRCLLVALLALALGRPIFGTHQGLLGAPSKTLYLVLDNSLTSSAPETIERLRADALRLLGTLDGARGDRVALLTAAGPADVVVAPPTSDLASVAELVRNIEPADSKADWAGALARVRDDLRQTLDQDPGAAPTVALFSDFRAGSADLSASLPGLGVPEARLTLLASPPDEKGLDNFAITEVTPSRALMLAGASEGVGVPLRVSIRRSDTSQPASGKVILRALDAGQAVDDAARAAPRAEAAFAFAPGQASASVLATLDLPPGSSKGRVMVSGGIDRDALERDNTFTRTLDLRERLRVVLLATPGDRSGIQGYKAGDWLALALAPDVESTLRKRRGEQLGIETIDPARALGSAPLAEADAVLIANPEALDPAGWSAVKQASERGAFIMVFAPAGVETHTWTDAFVQTLAPGWTLAPDATTLTPHAALAPASAAMLSAIAGELPELLKPVSVQRVLATTAPGAQSLLNLSTGQPALVSSNREQGTTGSLVFWAIAPDLSWTDLPTKPLMVPLVQELVRQGVGEAGVPRIALAGQAPALPVGAFELAPLGAPPVGVEPGGRLARPIRAAATFTIRAKGGSSLGMLSFNPDTRASDTTITPRPSLEAWLRELGAQVSWLSENGDATGSGSARPAGDESSSLSFVLLAGALALALVELVLARFYSHAWAESEARP